VNIATAVESGRAWALVAVDLSRTDWSPTTQQVAVFLPIALAILITSQAAAQPSPPRSVNAEFARAVSLFNEHDDTGEALAEAEHAFALVLARQPRHAAARAYQGLIALERGDSAAAEAAFQAALAIDTRCPEAHVGRVRLLRERSRWQASYDEARLAVRLAPDSVLARWELVDVLCHRAEAPVGDVEWNEAVPHLLRIIALQKAPRQAHMDLADIYRQQRRWREAIPHYQAVLRIGQTAEDSDVWVYEVNGTVADCYEKLGDEAHAADYLERYLRELRVLGASPESIREVERHIARLRHKVAA
jgi:tetratricopeptide (TPR) repeat protein